MTSGGAALSSDFAHTLPTLAFPPFEDFEGLYFAVVPWE
jgi:hypothetical protein